MKYTYKVYYRDDSHWNFDKLKTRLVRARTPAKAMEKFHKKYGIRPMRAV